MKHTPGLIHNFSAQLLQYYKDNSPDANKNQVQTNNRQSVVERTQNDRNNIQLTNIADEILATLTMCRGK